MKREGHRDLPNATIDPVVRAVHEIARPDGPTYLVLDDGEESCAQATGTDVRYVIESRTMFGEGFQHFRVARDLGRADAPALIHCRQRSGKHPPRHCPLEVRESEVSTFADLEQAALTFAATGRRAATLFWRDVTAEMVKHVT